MTQTCLPVRSASLPFPSRPRAAQVVVRSGGDWKAGSHPQRAPREHSADRGSRVELIDKRGVTALVSQLPCVRRVEHACPGISPAAVAPKSILCASARRHVFTRRCSAGGTGRDAIIAAARTVRATRMTAERNSRTAATRHTAIPVLRSRRTVRISVCEALMGFALAAAACAATCWALTCRCAEVQRAPGRRGLPIPPSLSLGPLQPPNTTSPSQWTRTASPQYHAPNRRILAEDAWK